MTSKARSNRPNQAREESSVDAFCPSRRPSRAAVTRLGIQREPAAGSVSLLRRVVTPESVVLLTVAR